MNEPLLWLRPTSPPLASFLLIHGLNNRREAMLPLAQELCARGIECALMTLPGHTPLPEEHARAQGGQAYARQWRHAYQEALTLFARQAGSDNKLLLALSLGALVGQYRSDGDQMLCKQILLAPALCLRWHSKLLLWAAEHFNFSTPSMAPAEIRAHRSLSSDYYRGLFELLKGDWKLARPSLVIGSTRDELVDWASVKDMVAARHDCQWLELTPQLRPYHWILSRASLGESQWNEMLDAITGYACQTATSS